MPEDYKNAGVLGVPNGSTMTPGEGLLWVDLGFGFFWEPDCGRAISRLEVVGFRVSLLV